MLCEPALTTSGSPFTVTTSGPAPLTTALADALQAQWQLGFPRTPDGVDQLTNGFYTYPAALQPLASRHLMRVVPDGPLLDPFCGSGTAVIEALRAGRDATGADASPLALWVAGAHTWRPEAAQAERLRALAAAAADQLAAGASFDELRLQLCASTALGAERGEGGGEACAAAAAMEGPEEDPVVAALWFCFCVAQQRAAKQRKLAKDPPATLRAVTAEYAHCVLRLAKAAPSAQAALVLSDARKLTLPRPVAAIVTSPPYPGVYDYLSLAREERALRGEAPVMGLPRPPGGAKGERVQWPEAWRSTNEIGARKARAKLSRSGPLAFAAAWADDQRSWLSRAHASLEPRGRAALLIGDGDSLDNLEATSRAAEAVGFRVLGSASISATLERTARAKGQRRTEHAVLLEA